MPYASGHRPANAGGQLLEPAQLLSCPYGGWLHACLLVNLDIG